MQEHIRRAHPNHYIPKLPATEESFLLMVNTPPDQRAHLSPPEPAQPRRPRGQFALLLAPATTVADGYPQMWRIETSTSLTQAPRPPPELSTSPTLRRPPRRSPWRNCTTIASPLTGTLIWYALFSGKPGGQKYSPRQDTHSDTDIHQGRMRSSIELPSLRDHFKRESLPPFSSPRPRELLPSILNHSPPGRSSTLPPIQRRDKFSRPRKSSITQSARKPRHERPRSKDFGRRPSLSDRKALSAEPQTAAWAQGKRWEDLIEAATSATEADDERYSEVCLTAHIVGFT